MDKNEIAREVIAEGHSRFRISHRLQAIAKRLNDRQLTRAVEMLEGCRVAHCAFLQDVAEEVGLDDATLAAASAPKDGGGK